MDNTHSHSTMTKDDTYHLLYWPGFPGRGELIRRE